MPGFLRSYPISRILHPKDHRTIITRQLSPHTATYTFRECYADIVRAALWLLPVCFQATLQPKAPLVLSRFDLFLLCVITLVYLL
jgi:hypothetical protein